MTPQTRAKLTEALDAIKEEGFKCWGFVLSPNPAFETFANEHFSRSKFVRLTEMALGVLNDNSITGEEIPDTGPTIYRA